MTISPALITERLTLRPWAQDDFEMLATLGADPAVIRWVGDGRPWTRERSAQSHARVLDHWARHGFGWRAAQTRDSGEAVGLIALNFAGEGTDGVQAEEYEIGWWIAPRAWRRGYGTEAAAAVRDEAFQRLGAPSIIARIQPDNAASRRLAESIGMMLDFETQDPTGIAVVVYRMDRARPHPRTGTRDG